MPKITDSSVNSKLQEACNTFVPTTINFTDLSQIKEFPDIGRQFSNDTQLFSSLTSSFFNKEAGEKIAKYYDLFVSKSNITVADFNSLRFSLHLAVNLLEDSLLVVSPEIIMNLLCNIEQSADMCVQGINSDLDLIISTLQAVREEGPDSSRTLVAKSLVDNLAGKFIFEMHQEGNLEYVLTEEIHVKNALTDNVSDIFKLPKSKDELASDRQIVSDEVHTKFKFLCKLLIPRYVIIDEMAQKFDSIFKDIFPHHYKDARSIINIPSEDFTSDFIDKIGSKLLAPFKHLKQGNTDETTNLHDFIEINSDGTCSIPYFYENIRVLLIKTIDDTIPQKVFKVIENKEGKKLGICTMDDAFSWVCDESDTIKGSLKKGDTCAFDKKNHIPLQLSHLTSLNFEEPTEKNYVYTLLIQALNQTDKVEDIKAFFLDGNGMDVLDKCPLAIKLKLSELLKNKTDENPVFKNELCKLFNEYLKSNVNIVVTEPVTLFEMYLYKKYENNNGDIADITSDLNASQIKNFSKMSIVKLFNNDDYRRLFDQVFYCKNKKIMESILSTDVCNELINQLDSEDDAPLIRAIKFNAPELIEPLLTKGDDADAWNQRAKEALSFAVEVDHVDCVKALLVGKVPVDSQDNNGITELMYTAENGYDGCVKALLEGGASVNIKSNNGDTALMLASKNGYDGCVNALLEGGASVNIKSNNGDTALMLASGNGYDGCVNALLEGGASVNIKSNNGDTALMLASENGYDGCVNALLEKGKASVNITNNEGATALMLASEKGQVDCVKALLKEDNVLIDSKDNDGQTALMLAAENGCTDCVNALLEGGASVNIKSNNGDTALMLASENDYGCVNALLEGGASVNIKGNDGDTALMLASYHGQVDCVKALLEGGALVNIKSNNGDIALMFASENGYDGCVNALLEGGASVNIKGNDGHTALMLASYHGQVDCVKALLEGGALVNIKSNNGDTALMLASKKDQVDCVKALLKEDNVLIDSKDNDGQTALMLAAENGCTGCVNVLLEKGKASVNITNNKGATALMLAVENGHADCAKALLEKDQDLVNIKDTKGVTALIFAVLNGHIDCVNVLLEAGASVNSKDSDDDTALIVAAENGYIDCVKALLKKDQGSINSKNKEGFTALMYAAKNGHIDCINALLEGGASVNIKNESGETAEMLADKNDHDDCVKLLQKKKARF